MKALVIPTLLVGLCLANPTIAEPQVKMDDTGEAAMAAFWTLDPDMAKAVETIAVECDLKLTSDVAIAIVKQSKFREPGSEMLERLHKAETYCARFSASLTAQKGI